jgi:hypothetical protein
MGKRGLVAGSDEVRSVTTSASIEHAFVSELAGRLPHLIDVTTTPWGVGIYADYLGDHADLSCGTSPPISKTRSTRGFERRIRKQRRLTYSQIQLSTVGPVARVTLTSGL